MYPKTPGCFSDLSAALYYKSCCFFLKLLIVLPVHFPLLHFTPPKVLRFYYNLTFRCVRYFGGSAVLNQTAFLAAMQKGRFCFAVEIKGKYVGGKGTVVPFFKSGLIFQMRC